MIAIITGDIVNSEKHRSTSWLPILKEFFNRFGSSPMYWEIYRGDEFQLKVTHDTALLAAIQLKAIVKSTKGLDVRMSIGVGLESYMGSGIKESNGSAYLRSGRTFENLKENKVNLHITTGIDDVDSTLNLMLRMALNFMDDWSAVSAQIVALVLDFPDASQKEIAQKLGIKQSAVSQRLKRARIDLVKDLLDYYKQAIKII